MSHLFLSKHEEKFENINLRTQIRNLVGIGCENEYAVGMLTLCNKHSKVKVPL